MCFSAGASFGASAVLSVIGAAAVVKARTVPQGLFAAIPFVFSIQQFAEGMLWVSFNNPGMTGQLFFTYVFLVFAILFWPVWIPLTVRSLEKNVTRKKVLTLFLVIGSLLSTGFAGMLLLSPAQAVMTEHHIHYELNLPAGIKSLRWFFDILYFAATIVPTFISGIKKMKLLGLVFAAAYLLASYFYGGFVVSVWCYFAAIMSIVVLWIMNDFRNGSVARH